MKAFDRESEGDVSGEVTDNNEIQMLKAMNLTLGRAIEALERSKPSCIEPGTNFYEEVARFEVDLIQRALQQTGGNQAQAARLLGLNQTTLHGKIKHYQIYPDLVVFNTVRMNHVVGAGAPGSGEGKMLEARG
jgi:DNA-binding NtrC family response regulator